MSVRRANHCAVVAAIALIAFAATIRAQETTTGEEPRLTARSVGMFNQYLYYGSFGRPRALAFDAKHSELWVADNTLMRIGVFRPDGAELFSFSSRHLQEPARLAVRPDGGIAVVDGDHTKIRLFDYRGAYKGDVTLPELGEKPVIGAIAYDPAGNFYVALDQTSEIVVFDRAGKRRLRFGSPGTEEGQFRSICAIAIGPDGRIYVADQQALAVQVFDSQGNFLRGWGRHEMGAANFSLPSGIALDSKGRIYVSDEMRHQIKIFNDEGKFLGVFGELGSEPGQLNFPTDLAIDGKDRIYVSERVSARVQIFEIVAPSAPAE